MRAVLGQGRYTPAQLRPQAADMELAAARQLQPALRRHRLELAAAGYCRLLL